MTQVFGNKYSGESKTSSGKRTRTLIVMDLHPIHNDNKTVSSLCCTVFLAGNTSMRASEWFERCEPGNALLLHDVTIVRNDDNRNATNSGGSGKSTSSAGTPKYFADFKIIFGNKSSAELITDSLHLVKPASPSQIFKYLKYTFDPISNLPRLRKQYGNWHSYTLLGKVRFIGDLEYPTEERSLYRRSIVIFDHSGKCVNCYLYGKLASNFSCLKADTDGKGDVIIILNCSIGSSSEYGRSSSGDSSRSSLYLSTGYQQQQQQDYVSVFAYEGKAMISILFKQPKMTLIDPHEEELRKNLSLGSIPAHTSVALKGLLTFKTPNLTTLPNISGFDLIVPTKILNSLTEYSFLGSKGGYNRNHSNNNHHHNYGTGTDKQKFKRIFTNVIMVSIDLSDFYVMTCSVPQCNGTVRYVIADDTHDQIRPYCNNNNNNNNSSMEDSSHLCYNYDIKIRLEALFKHPGTAKKGELQRFYLSWDYVYSLIKCTSAQFCFINREKKTHLLTKHLPFNTPVNITVDTRLYETRDLGGRVSTRKYGVVTNITPVIVPETTTTEEEEE